MDYSIKEFDKFIQTINVNSIYAIEDMINSYFQSSDKIEIYNMNYSNISCTFDVYLNNNKYASILAKVGIDNFDEISDFLII